MNVTIIIPSLNPDEKLEKVVRGLIEYGFEDIILVNDGSDRAHIKPFENALKNRQCTLLNHDVNQGKGRALKTAFAYCMENRKDIAGVITVDGDNQHTASDIKNCAQVMVDQKDNVILGVRNFKGKDVPFRSKFGNNLTSWVFRFACGLNISDTQTGLRAVPYQYLELFTKISGERFEYETNMLLELNPNNIGFKEVEIETVYIEDNASTHFNPIKDSLKIYGVIVKFLMGSIMSSVIDLGVFTVINTILFHITDRALSIFTATVTARILSSLVNYTFNRKAVFKSGVSIKKSLTKYYVLCVAQLCVSYLLVYAITNLLSLGSILTVVVKLAVDTVLFLISFQIQRRWVFKHEKGDKTS